MKSALPVALDAPQPTTVVVSGVRPPKWWHLDCRCCQNKVSRTCDSLVRCENGKEFKPLAPIELWRTV